MNRYNIICLLFIVSCYFSNINIHAQDYRILNLAKGDLFTLRTEPSGDVQWEQSDDNMHWQDLSSETGLTICIKAEKNMYYRARISEPDYDQIYSGTNFVRVLSMDDRKYDDSDYDSKVRIGVMRWDGWAPDDNPDSPYSQCLKCMKPGKWNDLGYWPWWSTLDSSGNLLELNANRPEVMEQENRYAYESKIDYWAFLRYNRESNPLNQQFMRYLESANKRLVSFCFIASPQIYRAGINEIRSMVNYMKDPQYFTVLDGRPLIYFFLATMTIEEVRDYFALVRHESELAGVSDPYMVLFNHALEWSYDEESDLGQDAYSEYCPSLGRSVEGSPYQVMIEALPPQWSDWAGENSHIVPSFTQQWDPRPYYENPPTWWPKPNNEWFQPPTQDEFRQNVQNAVDFVKEHPENCPSRTIIIKEWNGFTEGATICPSLKNGTMYVDALKQVIR